ncbi:MAG TPA: 1-phosphofructokinase [Anaerolineae bacterium]|nr:1-phosphofructokinase [Anaerolineae bacterium]
MIYTLTLNPALDKELTVPEIVFDTVLRASAERVDFGGKGFNVSRALAALGQESVALGFVGGATGRLIATGLAELGIKTAFVEIGQETRTNVSIVSQSQAHHLKVNEAGPTISPAEQASLLAKIEALAQPGDWWVLSGSLPPGLAPAIYGDIIQRIQAADARAILDTSGAPLKLGCAAGPFLAKPNGVEAEQLTGLPVSSPTEAAAATTAVHGLGVPHVLISLGRAGALLSDGRQSWLATPPAIRERNPIGAGDASVAGLVWGLSQGLALPDALRWSMASGAAAASLSGTAVGSKAQVEPLVDQVKISALELG